MDVVSTGIRSLQCAGCMLFLCLLCVKPRDDLVFLHCPVGFLRLDGGNDLEFKVVVITQGDFLIVGNFEQDRKRELCGS